MHSKKIHNDDLEHVFAKTKVIWNQMHNKTIFITGGTGFFGKWLLESFIYINEKLLLNSKICVLSRNPEKFLDNHPQFKQSAISFIKGEITKFEYPDFTIDYIIHAATEASVELNINDPLLMFDTIVNGTKYVLELAKIKNVKAILHTSSGAVYGNQPSTITHIAENVNFSPDIYKNNAAYGEGKRVAEMLASIYYRQYGVKSKIARCFAFVGPYLPLDTHFAIGNFIKDVINQETIHISGDGTPYRSYLYASDLTIWLWVILLKGETCLPYNVGSDEDITIERLAHLVSKHNVLNPGFSIGKAPNKDEPPQRYVPDIQRAKNTLGLTVSIPLNDSIKKTIQFYS